MGSIIMAKFMYRRAIFTLPTNDIYEAIRILRKRANYMRNNIPQIYQHIKKYQPPNNRYVRFFKIDTFDSEAERRHKLAHYINLHRTDVPSTGWNWELDSNGKRHPNFGKKIWTLNIEKGDYEWMDKESQKPVKPPPPDAPVIITCKPVRTKHVLYFNGMTWSKAKRKAARYTQHEGEEHLNRLRYMAGKSMATISSATINSLELVTVKK